MTTKRKAKAAIEYGDYQTPTAFARAVCAKLKDVYGISPTTLFEPTFGAGRFIESALKEFDTIQAIYGVELESEYFALAKERICGQGFSHMLFLYNEDIFSFDFDNIRERISPRDNVLLIGNPPWATNSQLSSLRSGNLPMKSNIKRYSGLDSITGKGNFDIAEYIILQLLSEFKGYNCTLAMLCKTIVAKNIIKDFDKYDFEIGMADMYEFNAKDVFGVNCDAALFVVKLGKRSSAICNVYDFGTNAKIRQFGWFGGQFLSDISDAKNAALIDGRCQFEWRQGVKHDCSKVMELTKLDTEGRFINGFGDALALPIGRFVFPLIKSSDIKTDEISETRKYVIVPQSRVNADTSMIKQMETSVWDYLVKYGDMLDGRKSIIYRKAPRFSIFGVGDYSFSKYKVGISGFYKEPKFALIVGEAPIMLDDTCYFLSFDELKDAVISVALLNSRECRQFLKSVAFLDSKRPFTKEVLMRIDLLKLSQLVVFEYICDYALHMQGCYRISKIDYQKYYVKLQTKNINTEQISLGL